MNNPSISPAALIFWPWHAFIDDIYDDWLSCPIDTAGDPMGYVGEGAARVVHRGVYNHVQEIWLGNQWYRFDMTGVPGNVPAVGDPMGYVGGVARVIYRSNDNHVHEIWLSDQWNHFDLSADSRRD